MPIAKEAPKLEKVAVTSDMKARRRAGRGGGGGGRGGRERGAAWGGRARSLDPCPRSAAASRSWGRAHRARRPPPPRPQALKAYATLRLERMNARLVGIRAKKAKEAEAAEKEN